MKIYLKITTVFIVLFISVCSIYGIYDPTKENTQTNTGEITILSSPEENVTTQDSTPVQETTGVANDTTADQSLVEYKAKVLQKISAYKSDVDGIKYQKIKVKVIDSGDYKDKEYEAEYILQILDSAENKELEVGTVVYVSFDNAIPDVQRVIVKDIYRIPYLILIVMIFLAIIVAIGGKKGIKTIVSLGITFLAIFYILIPSIINGYSAILMSIVICVIISMINLPLVGGFNKKSLVSILGTVSGVIVAGVLALIISHVSRITGLSNEDAQMLIYMSNGTSIDVYGLFFAGIIIGSVGATMDIAMSIASTMNELRVTSKNISKKELIKSGLNVGKDSMGTMANTLILAYVGESLILIILFILNNSNLISVVNSDFIASEILRSLCGIIGMISAIPITAYLYGVLSQSSKGDNKSK